MFSKVDCDACVAHENNNRRLNQAIIDRDTTIASLQKRCERLEDFKKGTRELLIRIYRDGIRKHRNIGEAIRKAELDMEYIDFEQALTNASPTGEEVESE